MTTVLAGPHATRMLTGLGGDVVKVERPDHPDPARAFGPACVGDAAAFFVQQNIGKRLLALDWYLPDGACLIREIADRFDVLVDDAPPGQLDKLGLSYEELSPSGHLIQCSITPLGASGTLSNRPADGLIAEALAGIHAVTGYPDRQPVPLGFMMGEFTAGSFALASICTALLGRARSGCGQHIEVAAYDALLAVHDSSIPEYNWTDGLVERSRPGSDRDSLIPYGVFPGVDGDMAIVATSHQAFSQLGAAIGCPQWSQVKEYYSQAGRSQRRDEIRASIVTWLQSMDSVWEAERWLSDHGVMAAVVRDPSAVLQEPVLRERRMIAEVFQDDGSAIATLNTPFFGFGLQGQRAPGRAGRDSEAVLREWGLSSGDIERLCQSGIVGVGETEA